MSGALRRVRRLLDRWRPFYWLRTHTVDRYHMIDCRSPRNGYAWGWIDRSELILYACFAILVAFVEREYPGHVDWKHDAEMQVQHDEIMALYRWWTVERRVEREIDMDIDGGSSDSAEDKDDEMLMRLMKVRGLLWT